MSLAQGALANTPLERPRNARKRRAWRRFARHKAAVVGLVWLCLIAVATIFGSWIAPHPLVFANFEIANLPPSWQYPFGTNELGQDMFSMAIYGTRFSAIIAVCATLISFVIGSLVGLTAGMGKPWLDNVLMRFTDFMFAFPSFFFSVILLALMGRGVFSIAIAIGILQWAGFARLIRGLVLTIRDGDLVESGVSIGASPLFIATRYVFPNVISSVIVYTAFAMVNMLNIEAMLSLMGFGPEPPKTDFGELIALGIHDILGYPWLMICPVAVFIVTLVSLVVVGEGLQSVWNPKGGA